MQYIGVILSVAFVMMILERWKPNVTLPKVDGWYFRALIFNSAQVVTAYAGTMLWDRWFSNFSVFSLADTNIFVQVMIGYLLITFVYYWWHRIRHSSSFLWRYFHQLHHSPARLEIITSFYKSPIELLANSLISSAILYLVLGLSADAVALSVLATALAELVYHVNLKTPHWMGYLFQRPEMHRIHHQRGKHHYNYADIPLWDMLFGTFSNPKEIDVEVGFPDGNEKSLGALLSGKRVTI